MSEIDRMLAATEAWTERFPGLLPAPPSRQVVVVACMDARIPVEAVLGLQPGDAHVLRNAGGVVTDDTLRSIAISQHLLGTEAVLFMHHTGCGMQKADEQMVADAVLSATGHRLPWPAQTFTDCDEDVRLSMRLASEAPYLAATELRGAVYDVATGQVREVVQA
jgi:carbonic anhydrase